MALFFALGTQWRRHAMTGAMIGLDYAAVGATAKLAGLTLDPLAFADLQLMERTALSAFADAMR